MREALRTLLKTIDQLKGEFLKNYMPVNHDL